MDKTTEYWERRYASGGNSGSGSCGCLAEHKADVVAEVVDRNGITSLLDLGCGDGNQVQVLFNDYPHLCRLRYVGVDVSQSAIGRCRDKFPEDAHKTFLAMGEYDRLVAEGGMESFGMAMSLDVLMHLVDDDEFDRYMRRLTCASRLLLVYAPDREARPGEVLAPHMRLRRYSDWMSDNTPWFVPGKEWTNPYPYEEGKDPARTSMSWFRLFERE